MLHVELFHPTYDRFLGPPCMLYNPWRDDAISPAHLFGQKFVECWRLAEKKNKIP